MSQALSQLRKFVSPEIIFGAGCRHNVANYASTFGARKVLVVSDPGVAAAGWLGDVERSLQGQGIDYCVYTQVSPNPRVEEVMLGAEIYRANNCNVIVAIGGGSPMDCAKGIGIVVAHGRNILEFEGVDTIRVPSPPLILIPTTAGTSADVSQFVIISNQQERMKFSIVSKAVVPDVSLIDPETTLSMDPFLSACTGIDALVHAIEAFVSTGSGPLTDTHALEAMRLINGNLVQMIANPHDIVLREKIMLGSMQAGLAFSNAILGAVHAMSHSLGGFLDLPHGMCNAALVEHVVAFNYNAAPERFRHVAETLGIDVRGLNHLQVRQRLVDHLVTFKQAVGFHETLKLHGVSMSDIPFLSAHAMEDPCILTNPRESSQRDVEVVYAEAL
ncbi:MAG: iron-containing alcohol dehydrogenase [Gammaproteobacteria bacterium]|uniref:Alcohol dehydrogenase, class IV n=1 Tax=Pseudomonas cuatrocienegasensis TaxID=543360 RepID=A0ABY1BPS8_9PSED|nr:MULTISPECIES: alcohol dehydrogenase-like regulatory protein ErcA [Pseudomonas]MBU1329751.1 iron-containing alcohol dehydrogenase [Gammaproteobacteria bacterium]MBU1489701.1 iron-containing alcohol dehydrogenase [Gammaproteobacteria bacterium]MBU2140726.1 iron-containing alcohol dehydrogenase [Gammaproteobacteria bacterium]MBU2215649.1 iron-containing alcohol dehydrogenase [Gammaproteobacteria bacterium]MBU2322053.1 iron-containing alcohol dehydrogenase [Gammaproteobacteria bacterium]